MPIRAENVPLLKFVPSEEGFVHFVDGGGGGEADEDLGVQVLFGCEVEVYDQAHFEVLAHYSNNRPKSRCKLPVDPIIQHVQ